RRSHPAEQVDRLLECRLVEDDEDVALVEAVVGRPDHGRGAGRLLGADGADLPTVLSRGAAVAGGGGCDVDVPPGVGEARQRAGTEELRVVGVREKGEGNLAQPATSFRASRSAFTSRRMTWSRWPGGCLNKDSSSTHRSRS